MFAYNNRYRGPFEYDKFVFNIFSFHNLVNDLETMEVRGITDDMISLKAVFDRVNNIYNTFTKDDGLCDRNYLTLIKWRER
jgi:hypothetical protein